MNLVLNFVPCIFLVYDAGVENCGVSCFLNSFVYCWLIFFLPTGYSVASDVSYKRYPWFWFHWIMHLCPSPSLPFAIAVCTCSLCKVESDSHSACYSTWWCVEFHYAAWQTCPFILFYFILFYFILLCLFFQFIFIFPTLSVLCDQELHQSSRIVSIVITCLQDQGFRQLWNYCHCCGHAFWSKEAFLSSVLSNYVLWRTTDNWNLTCAVWILITLGSQHVHSIYWLDS